MRDVQGDMVLSSSACSGPWDGWTCRESSRQETPRVRAAFLRAIEQALDNLQRLSSVTASVALRPGSAPGESDIVIARRQNRFCQLIGWLDNGAAHHDGRYRTGLMLALDNPAALSDRLSLAVSRTLGFGARW